MSLPNFLSNCLYLELKSQCACPYIKSCMCVCFEEDLNMAVTQEVGALSLVPTNY